MFDRETKREKIIEAKFREQKLKAKSTGKDDKESKKNKFAEAEVRMRQEVDAEFEELINKLVSYNIVHHIIIVWIVSINFKF